MRIFIICLCGFWLGITQAFSEDAKPPVRYAVVGLTHDHALGFLPRALKRTDVHLAGIVEANPDLCARYARRFNISTNLFFASLDDLLAHTNIQAVSTFTSTFEHRRVVEECAARHIDVMMEKPLAVSMEHARAIAAAAKKSGIRVMVNYETTWYPAVQRSYEILNDEKAIGDLRRIVVHDGHRGPREIGCSEDFLGWLTDPVQNGGGALMDFGCYGADLIAWLNHGQRPTSVFAMTQHIKPDVYPKVEDDATIVVTYPKSQGIIQASWNWPFDRKDMEVYGKAGYVLSPKSNIVRVRKPGGEETEEKLAAPATANVNSDQLTYLVAVVRREIEPSGLSSLENNMIVTEILCAGRESAETGKRVDLSPAQSW